MIESYARPVYQLLAVEPIAKLLQLLGIRNPNTITLVACLSGILAGVAIALGYVYLAVGAILFSGYCDTLDGTMARLSGSDNVRGTVYDIIADRIVEFAILLGLFIVDPQQRALMVILMLGSVLICITTFLMVGMYSQNQSDKSFDYSPGLFDRPEAFLFFILMVLFPNYFLVLSVLFVLLVAITTVRRLKQFLQHSQLLKAGK